MGESSRSERDEGNNHSKRLRNGKQSQKTAGTLFAGDMNKKPDSILQKRQQARKAAMKVMMDAHENEAKIDDDLKERKNKIKDLQAGSAAANQEVNEYKKLMEQAKVEYGVTDDSEQQQNLELLLKEKKANKIGSDVTLTEEERERLADMGPRTEYQKKVLELDAAADIYRDEISENHKQIMEETEISMKIRQERLKSHAMVDAVNEKDDMLLTAAKEEIGMLMDEAKDKIDEEQKKREEEAKKKAEEEKEKEEQLERVKQKREEVESRIEQAKAEHEAEAEQTSDAGYTAEAGHAANEGHAANTGHVADVGYAANAGHATNERHAENTGHAAENARENIADDMRDIQVMDLNQTKLSAELKNIIKSENLLDEDLLGIVVDAKK